MKLIVETNGPIQVYAPAPEHFAHYNRPSVVVNSHLMQLAAADGRLKILTQVNDDATDAELVSTLAEVDGDAELAVASMADRYPLEKPEAAEAADEPAPKKTRTKAE